MKNMFNVTTVLPHNLLQTNPCIRHNFSTQVFRKHAAQLHYVGPEVRYIFWPRLEARKCSALIFTVKTSDSSCILTLAYVLVFYTLCVLYEHK